VLVVVPSVRYPDVFEIARGLGFEVEDRALLDALRDRSLTELVRGTVRLAIFAPALPYHHTLIGRAAEFEVDGVVVPVISIEDLVVLKMLWRRAKDVPDIHALLVLAGDDFDTTSATETLASILPDDDPRHAELADWIDRFAGGPPA